jgi:tetratricopeptide (TPR) repeat protein
MDLYVKNFSETLTEMLISLRRKINKVSRLIYEYNNWPDWVASILCITLALLITFFLYSNYSRDLLTNFYNLLYWKHTKSHSKSESEYLYWLEILGFGLVISLLFLSFKFAARLKGIQLFVFFLLGFWSVQYWTECDNGNCYIKNFPVPTIPTLQHIITIILIVIFGIVFYLFISSLSGSGGITILPFNFDDETLNNQKDSIQEKKSIADRLAAELHHISHMHKLIEDGKLQVKPDSSLLAICRENINFPLREITGERLENTLAQLGTVSVSEGTSLQLGQLLLALQQLWPQGSVQAITGSIVKKQNTVLEIAARYQQSNRHSEVHAYKIPQNSQDSNKNFNLSELIEELAYRIALDLSPKPLSTNSWEAFKFFTEALRHICHYERTKSLDDLKRAKESCLNAKEKDKNYSEVGEILSLVGFYYLGQDRYSEARSVLEQAIEISPNNPFIIRLYGNINYYSGDYETALKHYNHAKSLKPNNYEIYIRIGILQAILGKYLNARKNFLKSRLLECDNHAAQSALAWLDFLCHLQELEDGQDREANWRLEKAYRRLNSMDAREITNIDYGNLAIVLLYQGGKENIRKAYDNWRKAFQSCPNITISDKIKHIFYELLVRSETIDNQSIIDRRLSQLNQLLQKQKLQENILPNALINDFLKDAKIIWKKCLFIENKEVNKLLINRILTNSRIFYLQNQEIEISGSESVFYFKYEEIEILDPEISKACVLAEEHRQLEFFMRKFITFLEWIKTL